MVKPPIQVFKNRKHHQGQALIETCMSLIVFAMLMGMLFTLSGYLYLQHGMITVAREGARMASLDTDLGESGDTSAVVDYIESASLQITGQDPDSVTVTIDPEGTDPRTVSVVINHNMQNPLNMDGFFAAYGGGQGRFNQIPVAATATMRYEG